MFKMKNLITIIALFFISLGFSQEENQNDINTLMATYVGNNNNVYYFKNNHDNSVIAFADVRREIVIENDLKNKVASDRVFKVFYEYTNVEIESKQAVDTEKSVTVKTFKKVMSLINLVEVTTVELDDSKSK